MRTFEFIKAVPDILLGILNAAYYAKPLIFIGVKFREKVVSHDRAVHTNC